MMLKHHIPVSFKETPMRLRSSGHLESPRWQNLVRQEIKSWPNARSHKMLALLIQQNVFTTHIYNQGYPDAKWHTIVLGHRFVSFSKLTKFPTSGAGNSNSSTAVKRSCQKQDRSSFVSLDKKSMILQQTISFPPWQCRKCGFHAHVLLLERGFGVVQNQSFGRVYNLQYCPAFVSDIRDRNVFKNVSK